MNTEQLKEYLASHPDESAYGLLYDADPKFEKRFQKLTKGLTELMRDINKHFPEATYYTASGGLHIVLGDTHSGQACSSNQELDAVSACSGLSIGDGDW